MTDRPVLHALVAWRLPSGEHVIRKTLVPLDEVPNYLRYGWSALLDPADESLLARWSQLNRTHEEKRQRWESVE